MFWLYLATDIDPEVVLMALAPYPVNWVLTSHLPDDQRPALLVTSGDAPVPARTGKTVILALQKLQASPDPAALIQGLLAELGVSWQNSGFHRQLEDKERVIQQLLRYRATSMGWWLEKLARPLTGVLGSGLNLWNCFERAQHPPRPLRRPEPVPAPDHPLAISLVTPSFQQSEYLERTIQSVLDQRYPWLDYRVQDGGSQDGSLDILRRYESDLSGWESAVDAGQAQAVNRAFRKGRGEIMGWLNSDDMLLPGALNYVARFFLKHPEVDLVYGHRILIDSQDRELGRWIIPPYSGDILSWADLIPQETMFWRRSLWEAAGAGLDESFQFALDWDLLLRFRAAGAKMVCLPRFLGAFRVHDRQKTSSQIFTTGELEMARLRERSLHRSVTAQEVFENCSPFYRRAKLQHLLYRLKLCKIQ